ncbi:hypothetical protein PM8797T_12703 [Gimesia maris DSM 8797]|nr:hypothetical protein PM8797T_12703 [Gimesia maris DSM 8797]|tara:strand:+ start:2201 stop:2368 length:168 start_codon:yes stop_codon:yes gene_type:complete
MSQANVCDASLHFLRSLVLINNIPKLLAEKSLRRQYNRQSMLTRTSGLLNSNEIE